MKVVDILVKEDIGILLELENGEMKRVDIGPGDNDSELIVNQIMFEYSCIPDQMRPKVVEAVITVLELLKDGRNRKGKYSGKFGKYSVFKKIISHKLPQCNFEVNNECDKLVTCGYDRTAIIKDIETSEEICKCEGHKNVVYCLAINSPFENKLATGSFDSTVRIWNFPSGEILHILEGHDKEVVSVDFNSSGTMLASCEMNKGCILWNADTGEMIHKLIGHTEAVIMSKFSIDSSMLITGSFDTTCKIWNTESGELINTFEGHSGDIYCIGYNSTNDKCFSTSSDKACCIWDSTSGSLIHKFEDFKDGIMHGCLKKISEREILAVCSDDGTAVLYNISTYSMMFRVEGHSAGIAKILFSPRGTHFVTASDDGTCKVWALSNGELIQTLEEHKEGVYHIGFSKNGDRLVSASKDQYTIIWDYALE